MSTHLERKVEIVNFGLIVTSDNVFKGLKKDEITPMVIDLLGKTRHKLAFHKVVPNDEVVIRNAISEALGKVDVVIVTGGTGPNPKRDKTINIVYRFNGVELSGFGELFRYLSFKEIGARAWLSRAIALVVNGKLLIALPGSPHAVRLALEKLILPVIGHAIAEIRGY